MSENGALRDLRAGVYPTSSHPRCYQASTLCGWSVKKTGVYKRSASL